MTTNLWCGCVYPGVAARCPVHGEEPEDRDIAEWQLEGHLGKPCPECGERGACAYDAEGRPLIHVAQDEDS